MANETMKSYVISGENVYCPVTIRDGIVTSIGAFLNTAVGWPEDQLISYVKSKGWELNSGEPKSTEIPEEPIIS